MNWIWLPVLVIVAMIALLLDGYAAEADLKDIQRTLEEDERFYEEEK